MSTRESITSRDAELWRPAGRTAKAEPLYARVLAWPHLHALIYLGSDLFAITVTHMAALHMVEHFLRAPANALNPFQYHRFYIPFFAVVLYLFEGYKSSELRRPEQELEKSCKAVAVGFLGLVLFNFVVFRSEEFSRYLLASWFLLAGVLLVAQRFMLRALHQKLWRAGFCRRRAVFAGSAAALSEYQQLLSIQRHLGYEVVGVLVDPASAASRPFEASQLPKVGSLDHWEEALEKTGANVLVVTTDACVPAREQWLGEVLRRCKQLRIDVELYSCVLATANMLHERDEFSGCFRFYAQTEWSLTVQRAIKGGIDVIIGLLGSIVTLLMMPILWMLVNLDERGPLFYRSAYLGQDGNTHYYLKFRTMHVDADRVLETDAALRGRFFEQHKLVNDPRVTRIGRILRKSSLDEFPQFFSVLVGDLAFVGPRTIRQEEAARYGPQLEKLLSVKSGLTGFWQVMGRQTTTYEERVHMDMFYVERWSIWLDLVIIAKTFWKVLKAEGAY
jgi:exopolysaccharide biosynthesis polyprenyl glycosylphosphotransferase